MSSLPEDIIFNILSRLPVKSIFRCRCVCKPWRGLPRDPNFIKMHLNHAIENKNFNLLLKELNQIYSVADFISSSSAPSTLGFDAIEIDYPLKSTEYISRILGSCNGLVCINPIRDVICLWNPSTKEYKELPPLVPFNIRCGVVTYGFGYDCDAEDYKLVRIASFYDYTHNHGSEVQVYTLGSDSWNSIGFTPYNFSCYGPRGVLFNGAPHWIATPNYEGCVTSSDVIVSFDIGDERFQEVSLPEEFIKKRFQGKNVGQLGGCLCLYGLFYVIYVEVWVMKEYGMRESWTKLFAFTRETPVIAPFCYLKPMFSFNNGEILIQKNNRVLILYDPNHETTRILEIRGVPNGIVESETYVGSLVSLHSGTFVGQEQIEEAV